MSANQQSVMRWMRSLFVVVLCALAPGRSVAADAAPAQGDEVAWGESADTWLNPAWSDESACPSTAPGMAGWLGERLPRFRVRHVGLGAPLEGTSWLNRPIYAGAFLGESFGTTLIPGEVDVRPSALGGLWLGHDLNHYWGSEIRLGLNYGAIDYLPDDDVAVNSRHAMADISLLYYPWGDCRWRPYAAVGLGIGGFHFDAGPDLAVDHTGLALPLGCGVKYLWGRQLVLRLDVKDNLVFGGNGVETTHNWSLTCGFEFHWGSGSSAQYYPW